MDWVEIVKIATPVVASVVQVLFGTKWWFSRSAKQANLFDRFTKEIAVRDALLKLKVSASESNSPEQISAKASGFKQAGEIEERFNKGLADLIRTPPLNHPGGDKLRRGRCFGLSGTTGRVSEIGRGVHCVNGLTPMWFAPIIDLSNAHRVGTKQRKNSDLSIRLKS